MKRIRFSEEQIIAILKDQGGRDGGLEFSYAQQLQSLEEENVRLKLLALAAVRGFCEVNSAGAPTWWYPQKRPQ